MKKIAVLGHGVVGSGVCELFHEKKQELAKKVGEQVELKYVLVRRDFPGAAYKSCFTRDFETILNDEEISVVAEVMGGLEPAYSYVKSLLKKGKHVVTSNKELVAAKGAELLAIAKAHNVNFFFEASVAAGVPVIRPMHRCLASNRIESICGILNGTTNFILTKMITDRLSFADALKQAQELGYAERDPSADVEGQDACRKICILASLAFGRHIYPEQVTCEGITSITGEDIAYAESWGGAIKLVGTAHPMPGGKIDVLVAPRFVPNTNLLSHVDDVFNGVQVNCDYAGELMFYGKGAGKQATASAVGADILDCLRTEGHMDSLDWADSEESVVYDPFKTVCRMYFRFAYTDKEQLEDIHELFSPLEELHRENQPEGEIAFISPFDASGEFAWKLDRLRTHGIKLLGAVRLL